MNTTTCAYPDCDRGPVTTGHSVFRANAVGEPGVWLCGLHHPESASTDAETPCPKREDRIHCNCWWDGDACCACGALAMSEALKREMGMIECEDIPESWGQ